MGTLGKIRNRSGLLLTVIGFAMLAFILGDFMQSKRSGGSSTPHVGEILGESILIQKFEETVELGKANWQSQNQKFGLYEIDNAILKHFRNNLKLKIEENEQLVDVPVMYASPENWKSIKKDGFLLSDDISGNNAFYDFCKKNNLKPLILKQDNGKGLEMGIIRKK